MSTYKQLAAVLEETKQSTIWSSQSNIQIIKQPKGRLPQINPFFL